jgi:hypothetical protein
MNTIPQPGKAELEARRTAATAALADYRRAVDGADTAERAMWGARLADMLGYLLAAPVPDAQDSAEARKLAEIRAILAAFDWEFHDRQLALEAIERIVLGEEAGQ